MYMKRKVLINKFKKYKNLNFHKNGLGPLYNWGGGWGGGRGGYLDLGLFTIGG